MLYACNKESTTTPKNEIQQLSFEQKVEKLEKRLNLKRIENVPEIINKDCVDPNITSGECFPIPISKDYIVNYNGCEFLVTGIFYYCSTSTGIYISVTDISFSLYSISSQECSQYITEGFGYWFNQDFTALDNHINTRIAYLEQLWQDALAEDFIIGDDEHTYICGDPGLDGNLSIKYYRSACYQNCFNFKTKEDQRLRCGFGCCIQTTEYCVNAITGEIEQTPEFDVISPCDFDPEPNPGTCFVLGDCPEESCARPSHND